MGIAASDDVFDPLTIIGGTIEMKDGRLHQSFDCRYPTSTTAEHLTEMMTQVWHRCHAGGCIFPRAVLHCSGQPGHPNADHHLQRCDRRKQKPFTMGGGTYARHFPYAVSFGPEHTDIELPEFAGPMHGANEGHPV